MSTAPINDFREIRSPLLSAPASECDEGDRPRATIESPEAAEGGLQIVRFSSFVFDPAQPTTMPGQQDPPQ